MSARAMLELRDNGWAFCTLGARRSRDSRASPLSSLSLCTNCADLAMAAISGSTLRHEERSASTLRTPSRPANRKLLKQRIATTLPP